MIEEERGKLLLPKGPRAQCAGRHHQKGQSYKGKTGPAGLSEGKGSSNLHLTLQKSPCRYRKGKGLKHINAQHPRLEKSAH